MQTSHSSSSELRNRLRGALIGLAVGDALGTTVEFRSRGSFEPVVEIVGKGPFNLRPGEWTDDTSMALCLAESLVERRSFDPIDQLKRYVDWWRKGHLSSTGRCFDIGNQTRASLQEFERTQEAHCGPTGPNNAGNGSLMRLSPVAIAFHTDIDLAMKYAAESSRTTHGSAECVDACRYFASLLVEAIRGTDMERLFAMSFSSVNSMAKRNLFSKKIAAIAGGAWRSKQPREIRGSGYVVESLEAAIWSFGTTKSFEEAVLRAVNLGDDADTTGAICGQLAGAFYGESSIPSRWQAIIAKRETISTLADGLIAVSPVLCEAG